jgi:hypothetical protein
VSDGLWPATKLVGKKLNSLLNSLFAQQTSKMLRKSFPVAPTAICEKRKGNKGQH